MFIFFQTIKHCKTVLNLHIKNTFNILTTSWNISTFVNCCIKLMLISSDALKKAKSATGSQHEDSRSEYFFRTCSVTTSLLTSQPFRLIFTMLVSCAKKLNAELIPLHPVPLPSLTTLLRATSKHGTVPEGTSWNEDQIGNVPSSDQVFNKIFEQVHIFFSF